MIDTLTYDQVKIGLATAEDIRSWSHGEVKNPETINYRSLKPELGGTYCERIFGPTKDYQCACGKYKQARFKGIVCEHCRVELLKSDVRRERMGHIELNAPVTHVWYWKGVPSRLGYLLDIAPKDLEKVIYYAAYMVTMVDEDARHRDLDTLQAKVSQEIASIERRCENLINKRSEKLEEDVATLEKEGASKDAIKKVNDAAQKELKQIRDNSAKTINHVNIVWERFKELKVQDFEGDEAVMRSMKERFGRYFEAYMGAEAIKRRLASFDIEGEHEKLLDIIKNGKGQRKSRALKRLKVVRAFVGTGNSPMGMVLDCVPVLPADLRPIVHLDGGRIAVSDLTDLYRRVINRNNRLAKMLENPTAELIINNEKRMLQEAVDALFDNGRRGRPVTATNNKRPLKSLADMLKGKQGRFRQNLLGKRVDYSGRSVIVVGPQLKLHQCGLPKQMALELFKPYVMRSLIKDALAQTSKAAKKMVERQDARVWQVLEEVIREHPVLLNRAPTLHRLGIQAFEPQLIEGKAIQLHPLVCAAFNADFDGDQMAVHLPLSNEAQAEARLLMLSSNNILKPADGRPVALPSHEMIIGMYYLTMDLDGLKGEGRAFASPYEAQMAYELNQLDMRAKIKVRMSDVVPPASYADKLRADGSIVMETTLGKITFNRVLPEDFPFVDYHVGKKQIGAIINQLAELYPKTVVTEVLDKLKDLGFYWGTRSGVTVSIGDVQTPPDKPEIMAKYEAKAATIDRQYERGAITEDERRQDLIQVWGDATDELTDAMEANFTRTNPIFMMIDSGARGNKTQMRQIAAMRGLVANPKGEIIARPIKSNFREGLTVLEYFISTHGGRKGQADTALRTSDSGYLTRRLVDVSQDIIIREVDCGTEKGLVRDLVETDKSGNERLIDKLETSVLARNLAKDAVSEAGEVIVPANTDLTMDQIQACIDAGIKQVTVRSVLTCDATTGVCAMCYGRSMAGGKLVEVGEVVGIQAAQSIGEPGTQLTMRTFHTGGVAGDDITLGLPRVAELFEARTPKGKAPVAAVSGRLKIENVDHGRKITIIPDDPGITEAPTYHISKRAHLEFEDSNRVQHVIKDGVHVNAGDQLTAGTIDPQDLLSIVSIKKVQQHLVDEVQKVYATQGAPIHDKHIEIIVHQMLRRVSVINSGDTDMMPGDIVDVKLYNQNNRKVMLEGGQPAQARQIILGITKAALATDSWLSAASFQETTKILTDAALNGKSDQILGLKENVIIGKQLIPAGTGLAKYRNIKVEPTPEANVNNYQTLSYDDPYSYDWSSSRGTPMPLDDLDYREFR